jgi:hypothetical protein
MDQLIQHTQGLPAGISTLRNAQLEFTRQPAPRARGERLMAACFRGLCRVMQMAAQFSGTAPLDGAARPGGGAPVQAPSLDLQALYLSGPLPLCEIAAAAREAVARGGGPRR